jgi:AraC-like DNA-binding protein
MRAATGVAIERYSTSDLPTADRHEAWANRDWPSLAPIYRTTPTEPFDIVSYRLQLGHIAVQYCTITGQRWERDAAMRRSHNPDALCVAITVRGEALGIMGESAFSSGAGCVQLSDLTQISAHESTASETILCTIPRPVATQRGLDVSSLHGAVLRSGAASMLGAHLLQLRRAAPGLAVDDGPLLERVVMDLLVVAVGASGRDVRLHDSGRATAALIAARDEIERRLESPSLTISNLCRVLGISRTTLHRLFEEEGGVQAYIRTRRLEAARRLLADPANGDQIYVLAERLGFSDAAHLSRLFRARYGMTPSDYRASRLVPRAA